MDEDEHVKDVYAHFGLAMYLAQVLEHGIVNALVYTDLIPRRAKDIESSEQWVREFDDFMNGQFEHTLGKLIKVLTKHVPAPRSLEGDLRKALKKRNFLAHGFFREYSEAFMSFDGRNKMLMELEGAQSTFSEVDEKLEAVIRPYRIKVGFTDEHLQKEYEELLSEVRE